jgi:hypothetical protein
MKTTLKLDFKTRLDLNESESRALDALAGYGTDSFLKIFYEKMGRHYLEPYEDGLRSLFEKISNELRPEIRNITKMQRQIKEALNEN